MMPNPEPGSLGDAQTTPEASLATIYWVFFQIGALSFGGGLSAWTYLEFVERRKLLREADFIGGLTLAQVLPGINMANLSIYTGQRLRGVAGAATAIAGLISVPFFAIIAFASVYASIVALPFAHAFLDGLATAAVGLLLAMGVKAVKASRMQVVQLATMALVVLTVGVLRWSMIPIIVLLAPISVALAWQRVAEATIETAGKPTIKPGSGDAKDA